MKYILILLVSFAFGQDLIPIMPTYSPYEKYMNEQDTEKIMMVHRNMIAYEQPITLKHLFEYAEECYNDTIKEYWLDNWEVQELNRRGYYFIYNPSDNRKELIFVKVPTFEGFIEWLKK